MNRNEYMNMKVFIEMTMSDDEESELLKFLDNAIKKTADDEIFHGMHHFDIFLKKKNIKLKIDLFKIYFIYFLWVGYHFSNVGAQLNSNSFYEFFDLKVEGIEIERFLFYESEVLEFFEDVTGNS